ncbi:MAG TPA: hypothetical protein PL094_08320, partial [Acinetobacter johnsonii]|nr:hypothetical protein [Acinetobacter johnsonii]
MLVICLTNNFFTYKTKTNFYHNRNILMKKEIVILATSLKHGNRCVAGKTINTKEWIRPVSKENGDAIELEQTAVLNTRTNKKWPLKLLQKTEIIFSKHVPRP